MKHLQNLLNITEDTDMTELTQEVMSKIQSNIRKGAADHEQHWSSALELVQRAYKVSGVQRPDPYMRSGWKQYEENISYAVAQMAKFRGLGGDWRLSSALVTEADSKSQKLFQIQTGNTQFYSRANSISEIIDQVKKKFEPIQDVNTTNNNGITTLTFSKWGIISNKSKIIISEVL